MKRWLSLATGRANASLAAFPSGLAKRTQPGGPSLWRGQRAPCALGQSSVQRTTLSPDGAKYHKPECDPHTRLGPSPPTTPRVSQQEQTLDEAEVTFVARTLALQITRMNAPPFPTFLSHPPQGQTSRRNVPRVQNTDKKGVQPESASPTANSYSPLGCPNPIPPDPLTGVTGPSQICQEGTLPDCSLGGPV